MPTDRFMDESPSLRPVLFVLALFVGALAAAAGTTGAAVGGTAASPSHGVSHRAVHGRLLLAAQGPGH
jgi:hypothetical protein